MKRIFRLTIVSMLLVTLCIVTAIVVANRTGGASVWPLVQTAAAQSSGQGQPQNCSNNVLSGRYGFNVQGTVFVPPVTPAVAVGVADFNGSGSFTLTDVASFAGTIVPRTAAGTYTVAPNCTATSSLTILTGVPLGATFHVNFVILDRGSEIMLVQTDPGSMFTGTAKRQ